MDNTAKGSAGEKIAAKYLQSKGYSISEMNWRFDRAEIDIICRIDELLVFVEVKSRSGTDFGFPEQAVSKTKQRHLARAAEQYLYEQKYDGEIRYDIVSVLFQKSKKAEILHLEDAFFPIF